MDNSINGMALRSFGYGRWDAPYWFIGPEQGQGRGEENDSEKLRFGWTKSVGQGQLQRN
jgi:hypothetical protein